MRSASPVEGRIQGHDGTPLKTLHWPAPGAGQGVLLVHGLGEHGGRYGHVARALSDIGLGAFAWDHRGHGGSGGQRGHAGRFEELLLDMDRALEAATRALGAPPAWIVGHSMGGLVSLAWCQTRDPALEGLVASAPWLATARPVPRALRTVAGVLDRWAPRIPISSGNDPEVLTSDPEMMEAWRQDPLVHGRITPRLFGEAERAQARVRAQPGRLKVPSLFLVPGADRLADAQTTLDLARALPPERTTVVELPGFRHEAFNETDRARALGAVQVWMQGRRTGGGA